jgi:surface polysaccharide O-acyltransferase-like enzyme
MQQPETSSNHLRWVDLVRAIGALLVVIAHVQFQGGGPGWVVIFYFVISRIAVPMFFMASGYLLLGKEEPYIVFFKKRALKVIVPFLAWSVIYMLWKQEYFGEPFSLEVAAKYIIKILRGPRENHLWFFYALIGLYLFTPILRVFTARASMRDLVYFCGLWFLVTPVLYTLQEFTPLQFGFELYLVAGYTGYYMLGYLVGKLTFNRFHLYALTILFWVVCVVSIAIIYINSINNNPTQYFGDYISLNIVFMSVTAFILLREAIVSDKWASFITPFSKASFGIYLIHVIVLVEMGKIHSIGSMFTIGDSIYMIPLLGLIGFLVSFILVYILQKILVVRHIVP